MVFLKILVASHGTFASGLKSSVDILLGKSDNLTVIDAFIDQTNYEDKLDEFFKSIPDSEQVIMLSDLYGGSVNQKMNLKLAERSNTFLVAGINLAFLLALSLNTEPITEETLKQLVKESREALRIVEVKSKSAEEEDFFGGS